MHEAWEVQPDHRQKELNRTVAIGTASYERELSKVGSPEEREKPALLSVVLGSFKLTDRQVRRVNRA